MSSRGYLVASDDEFVCSVISYSEVKIGLEPLKSIETREKSFWKTSFQAEIELKKVYKQGYDDKSLKNPTPLRNDAVPFSGLQHNALASLVRFVQVV